jgi:hypothetical protein
MKTLIRHQSVGQWSRMILFLGYGSECFCDHSWAMRFRLKKKAANPEWCSWSAEALDIMTKYALNAGNSEVQWSFRALDRRHKEFEAGMMWLELSIPHAIQTDQQSCSTIVMMAGTCLCEKRKCRWSLGMALRRNAYQCKQCTYMMVLPFL